MPTKYDVIRLNREHPEWGAPEIAKELGCDSGYVRATAHRNGLTLANSGKPGRPPFWTPEMVAELRNLYSVPSTKAIAARFGVSVRSVIDAAVYHNIPRFTDGDIG